MSITQPRLTTIGLLAAWTMIATRTMNVSGGEPDAPAPLHDTQAVEYLVSLSELDEVNMSIIDEKLAMSLAVEAHVHMDVLEFALRSMNDAALKALTARKLQVYRQLYDTLDELTCGRVESMLARRSRQAHGDTATDSGPQTTDTSAEPRTTASRRGGGLGSVLQGAATKAILRVRLQIAEQYAILLRAELEASPPGEFDRRYLNVELYNQMQVLSMLRVFEQQASPEFARIIHVATAATEGYMVESRQLAEQLKSPLPIAVPAGPVVTTSDTSGT